MENRYVTFPISKYLNTSNETGNDVHRLIDSFRCPINQDVEKFLHHNAVEFTQKKQSITHLICNDNAELLGYFTTALKPLTIQACKFSNTAKKKIERLAKYDSKNDSYTVCAYLIAQLGKNYGIEPKKRISGQVLLARAQDVIEDSQTNVGGIIEFLECENNKFLKKFYEDNHFTYFDSRYTESLNSKLLLQYFKFI